MKFVLLISLFVTFTAFAGESKQCTDAVEKADSLLAKASNTEKFAGYALDEAQKATEADYRCSSLKEALRLFSEEYPDLNNSRKAYQEALLYCKDMKLKQGIIANLDGIFDAHFQAKSYAQQIPGYIQQLGCPN